MTVICNECKTKVTTMLLDKEDALKDLLSLVKTHFRYKHPEIHAEMESDFAAIIKALPVVPGYLIFGSLIDIDNSETSEIIRETYMQMEEILEPLAELFDTSDDGEELQESEVAVTDLLDKSNEFNSDIQEEGIDPSKVVLN